MVLLALLTAVIAIAQPASAEILCCGDLGKWDEAKVWAQRQTFCSNPRAGKLNEEEEEGYVSGKDEIRHDSRLEQFKTGFANLKVNYFYGRIDEKGKNFDSCWRATQELIEQCARQGKAHGSWKDAGEAYGMTLTGDLDLTQKPDALDVARRSSIAAGPRHRFAKRSIDDLSSISSHHHLSRMVKDGEFFDVDGEDIHITFHDTVADLPKHDIPSGSERGAEGLWRRSEGLQTTEGIAYHWNESEHFDVDLAAVIRKDLARFKREEARVGGLWHTLVAAEPALGKRGLEGPTSALECWNKYFQGDFGGFTWTVIEWGTFLRRGVPTRCVGDQYLKTGANTDVLMLQQDDEGCESYSQKVLVMPQLMTLVRKFASKQGYDWKQCYTAKKVTGATECADKWKLAKG